MKKIFTLLVLCLTLFSFKSTAQLSCNPAFTKQFLTGSLVKFIPVTNDSPAVQHYWLFGDGSTPSSSISPTHLYVTNGVFVVKHFLVRHNSNNVIVCTDSASQTITIGQSPFCNLSASFYSTSTSFNPLIKQFYNTSLNFSPGDSIRWNFGDGTVSYLVNPTHTFANYGVYNVCLRVKKANTGSGTNLPCVSEICHVNTITPICNLQAYFTNTPNGGTAPATIQFTNQSTLLNPTDSITWTFGDGTSSNSLNPAHVYTSPGNYTVCLRIRKNNTVVGTPPCISVYCKTITITAACNLVSNFTFYRDSLVTIPNSYHFTNTTVPLSPTDSIRWTFGDGTSSNQINPVHVYAQAGNYNVCLRVIKRTATGTLTNCISEKCHVVLVPQQCNVVASFTHSAAATNPRIISFTNTSLIAPSNGTALWTFGDGTSATTWNAVHQYLQAGRYYVCLRIQYGTCVNTKCDSITVTANPPTCSQLSQFSFVRSATNNNLISFSPNIIDNTVQYTWTFGDGTGSQNVSPTHQFANTGYYTVCLTAFRNNSCATTTCQTVYVASTINCNNITLGFNDVRDPLVLNRITFFATSNTAITNQLWTIAKLPATATSGTATITTNNPTYVFLDSGNYRVCLKVTFAGGCVKEFCKIIHIAQSMPFTNNCSLQVYPNPTSAYANAMITLAQPLILNGYIYNNMNMLVAQKQQQGFVGNNTMSINVGSLPAGIYTFRLLYGNQICNSTFVKL